MPNSASGGFTPSPRPGPCPITSNQRIYMRNHEDARYTQNNGYYVGHDSDDECHRYRVM